MTIPSKNIHIIAIGGAVMSSLAVALKRQGHLVTGSDDRIYDPAKSHLEKHGLMPASEGWDDQKISKDIDTVILGMHAKADNPELLRAKELGISVMSYPEFVRSQCNDKQRIVIAGSHGKTTITGIIIHVLKSIEKPCDFVIGAKIAGIDNTVKLSDAPVIIIEGDEYFTSPLDLNPKFSKYDHHIAIISGTQWDHVNVYPTLESYIEQFEKLADSTPKAGVLIFSESDKMAYVIGNKERNDIKAFGYKAHAYKVKDGQYFLKTDRGKVGVKLIGKHNMQNIEAARLLLSRLGITDEQFYQAIATFEGAEKRNTLVAKNNSCAVYNDYAHSPSKLKATVDALKELHAERKLTACFELHTFSSLNADFLPNYQGKFDSADEAIVFVDAKKSGERATKEITPETIKNAFARQDLTVFTDKASLEKHLMDQEWKQRDLLLMSSGNFDSLDIESLAVAITKTQ